MIILVPSFIIFTNKVLAVIVIFKIIIINDDSKWSKETMLQQAGCELNLIFIFALIYVVLSGKGDLRVEYLNSKSSNFAFTGFC